ncbi:hypothetical protein LCGC14_2570890 [marine sediment metagenome]|uniref:Uncharacterized protein n=1 Tax=marine sediment metagenome TaxID=412755 RepID=A0A0F9B564_9ZZZZ
MRTTSSNISWEYSDTAHFNGILYRVFEEVCVILEGQSETTREFVESEEFQMLLKAGIEVHGKVKE